MPIAWQAATKPGRRRVSKTCKSVSLKTILGGAFVGIAVGVVMASASSQCDGDHVVALAWRCGGWDYVQIGAAGDWSVCGVAGHSCARGGLPGQKIWFHCRAKNPPKAECRARSVETAPAGVEKHGVRSFSGVHQIIPGGAASQGSPK